MATKSLAHGMGTFYKDCEHAPSRWSKCPHEYKIRYRSAAGKQTEEAGFSTQQKAITRLTTVYQEKKAAPRNQSNAERVQKYGAMQFREYTAEWKAGQRDLAESSLRTLESLLEHHILPTLGSRRMSTFDHKVVDGFIRTMERNGAGLATQSNAFDKVKSVLLDAYRLGIYTENPVLGVKPPQYDPERAVIPSPAQLRDIRTAGDDRFLLIADLMSGCGMRNGEAFAANLNNLVAGDVYRITEQVNQTTKTYGRLKHRKPTDYRDVPLPARVRETIEWYADKHGTVDGYLLRHPMDPTKPYLAYYLQNQWQRIKRAGEVDVPDGMVIYSLRHFFASNCLTNGIPITDVAKWMGHKSLDITFKIYRHLMPGSIGKAGSSVIAWPLSPCTRAKPSGGPLRDRARPAAPPGPSPVIVNNYTHPRGVLVQTPPRYRCAHQGPSQPPRASSTRGLSVGTGSTEQSEPRQPVMADVARVAGVSHQTVSRVLNGAPHVRPGTRERVLAAIRELDYRPNVAARTLVTRRSQTLGVVSFGSALYGPASMLDGIEQAARSAGYFVSVASLRSLDTRSVQEAVDRLRDQGVEGIVVIAPQTTAVSAVAQLSTAVPVVAVGAGSGSPVPTVSVDNEAGAEAVTRHLLDLGHATVHHIAGPPGWLETATRQAGWCKALEAAGAPVPEAHPGDWSARGGYQAGLRLAADLAVTAVFCANDHLALGLLRALHEAGRAIPGDISVVGFDDIAEAAYFAPPLTTVRQDFGELGRRALELLVDEVTRSGRPSGAAAGRGRAGSAESPGRHVLVPTEIVLRRSSGRAPR